MCAEKFLFPLNLATEHKKKMTISDLEVGRLFWIPKLIIVVFKAIILVFLAQMFPGGGTQSPGVVRKVNLKVVCFF